MADTLSDTLQQALGGTYRIERELGGGGMSRVFVAHDPSLDRDVVVKVLSAESTNGISGDRFRREIQVIARLQHPHIVSILSAGTADGALYYIMPFVRGETLRARMTREGPMAIPHAVRLLREVLDALAFAHGQGVVHRDIKPENVLLEAGHAVVADFGIAKALSEAGNMTSVGIALGTPAYMAPEQATADPNTDHRADLYAVGVLAYELLTGSPPFIGSAQQVITAHITTPAPAVRTARADVPDALSQLVAHALAKDPSARPQSANEMLTALDALSTSSGTRTHGVFPRSARKGWPIGAAVLVLAIAASAAVFLQSRSAAAAPVVAEGAELIAVMPLIAASDTSLTRLGQDLVVTLSANLDGVGALRSIDAATLLMRARKLPSPMPLADAQQLAMELGAKGVMTGTLVSEGDRVRASVVLRVVGTDSTLAKASALATPREIAALTDSLSWSVLRQVWRRGTSPSPVLAGLTSPSFDALRAFLDGERRFQRLELKAALADYRRAFELDTAFAQAYLRYDYVNEWNLQPRDSAVHARLLALRDRLPERERLWVETRERSLPIPERVAEWKALIQRFPDYPPFIMAAADRIIHTGPIYGIPLAEAQPLLDRLEQLVPDHADTKFHQSMVTGVLGTPAEAAALLTSAAHAATGPYGRLMEFSGEILSAEAAGQPMPTEARAFTFARSLAQDARDDPSILLNLYGYLTQVSSQSAYQLDLLERIRKAGIYSGELGVASAYSESGLRVSRGDWNGAVSAARRLEDSGLPVAMRQAMARTSALGAWLGTVDPMVADSAVQRARSFSGARPTSVDRAELSWLNGLVGVVRGDEPRVRGAMRELSADTLSIYRNAARSLGGLWVNRSDPNRAADSLKAVSDDTMRSVWYVLAVEAVNRIVVARGLRRAGQSADAERYIMWPDARLSSPANAGTASVMSAITEFERGRAFDAAGNRTRAIVHYRRFVDKYDQPPPAHRAMVDTAKARLSALEKPVAGRR